MTTQTQTTRCQTMRVNREFAPHVAQQLEQVDPDMLEIFLANATQEPIEIPDWQRKELEEAERSIAQGRGIPFEEVKKKMLERVKL
ncbi:hypothetical protein H8D83_01960 [Candidatus Woesearchaeota archaeon]|nr:hypothetical protein [Candidatus Woesearchaeota archaeon]